MGRKALSKPCAVASHKKIAYRRYDILFSGYIVPIVNQSATVYIEKLVKDKILSTFVG